MMELNLLVKRGKLAAGKAIAGSLMLHHHYAGFTCRSSSHDAHLSFVSPRDYEFSCSNSPAFPFHARAVIHNKLQRKRNSYTNNLFNRFNAKSSSSRYDDVSAVQKVLIDMLSTQSQQHEINSTTSFFPGFGKSPIGRQLRITDSPFPLDDVDGGDSHVDKAAEEFINKFYKDLHLQKTMASLEYSPNNYNNYFWDR